MDVMGRDRAPHAGPFTPAREDELHRLRRCSERFVQGALCCTCMHRKPLNFKLVSVKFVQEQKSVIIVQVRTSQTQEGTACKLRELAGPKWAE
jgi:hypothetical protein